MHRQHFAFSALPPSQRPMWIALVIPMFANLPRPMAPKHLPLSPAERERTKAQSTKIQISVVGLRMVLAGLPQET